MYDESGLVEVPRSHHPTAPMLSYVPLWTMRKVPISNVFPFSWVSYETMDLLSRTDVSVLLFDPPKTCIWYPAVASSPVPRMRRCPFANRG